MNACGSRAAATLLPHAFPTKNLPFILGLGRAGITFLLFERSVVWRSPKIFEGRSPRGALGPMLPSGADARVLSAPLPRWL